jgi:hypothetical protein
MGKQDFLRVLLFVIFFTAGAAALGLAILCDEMLEYLEYEQVLIETKDSRDKLKSLIEDYQALLEEFERDPNIYERIAPIELGSDRGDANTVYPKPSRQLIAKTNEILQAGDSKEESWLFSVLNRCNQPRLRLMLFISGALLVLVSFVCFSPMRSQPIEQADAD